MRKYRNIWHQLGLAENPRDVRAVKRAYAAKLKLIKNDPDPEVFILLREVYEEALDASVQSIDKASAVNLDASTHAAQYLPISGSDPIDIAFRLLKEPETPDIIDQWHLLFEHPKLQLVDDFLEFEQNLLYNILRWRGYFQTDAEFVNNSFNPSISPLTPNVLVLLWDRFGWDNLPVHTAPEMSRELEWLREESREAAFVEKKFQTDWHRAGSTSELANSGFSPAPSIPDLYKGKDAFAGRNRFLLVWLIVFILCVIGVLVSEVPNQIDDDDRLEEHLFVRGLVYKICKPEREINCYELSQDSGVYVLKTLENRRKNIDNEIIPIERTEKSEECHLDKSVPCLTTIIFKDEPHLSTKELPPIKKGLPEKCLHNDTPVAGCPLKFPDEPIQAK